MSMQRPAGRRSALHAQPGCTPHRRRHGDMQRELPPSRPTKLLHGSLRLLEARRSVPGALGEFHNQTPCTSRRGPRRAGAPTPQHAIDEAAAGHCQVHPQNGPTLPPVQGRTSSAMSKECIKGRVGRTAGRMGTRPDRASPPIKWMSIKGLDGRGKRQALPWSP